jgi:hypothetical protein
VDYWAAADMRTAMKYILDDSGGTGYTTAQLNEAIQRAIDRIASDIPFMQMDQTIAMVVGQAAYTISVDSAEIIEIRSAILGSGADQHVVRPLDPRDGRMNREISGRPIYYYLRGRSSIEVYPLPDRVENLVVAYKILPYYNNTQPQFPVEAETLLLLESVKIAIEPEGNAELTSVLKQIIRSEERLAVEGMQANAGRKS